MIKQGDIIKIKETNRLEEHWLLNGIEFLKYYDSNSSKYNGINNSIFKDTYVVSGFRFFYDYFILLSCFNIRTKRETLLICDVGINIENLIRVEQGYKSSKIKIQLVYGIDLDKVSHKLDYMCDEEFRHIIMEKRKELRNIIKNREEKNIYYVGDKVRISNKEYIIDRIIIKTELIDNKKVEVYEFSLETETNYINSYIIDNLDDISLVQRTKRKSLFFNTVIVKELKQYGEVFYEL